MKNEYGLKIVHILKHLNVSKTSVFLHIPTGALAVIKSVCLLGLLCPALLTADTLNVYSRPSMRPEHVYSVDRTRASFALTQSRLFLSLRSIEYPMMGLPPSVTGVSQDNTTNSLLIFLTQQFLGSLGGSEKFESLYFCN